MYVYAKNSCELGMVNSSAASDGSGLQEVVDGDLVPQGLLNLSLDLGNFPARRKITTKAIFQQNQWPAAVPTTNYFITFYYFIFI